MKSGSLADDAAIRSAPKASAKDLARAAAEQNADQRAATRKDVLQAEMNATNARRDKKESDADRSTCSRRRRTRGACTQ